MMRAERGLEPELEAFLNHHRIERTVPPEIRVRTLAAARSVVAAAGAVPAASLATGTLRPASVPMPVANVVRDHLLTAQARGRQELDWSSLAKVVAENAGL